MKPSRFAKKECANHFSDGSCLDSERCKLYDKKKCPYFERAVLPLADEQTKTAYETHED